ncbi:MAG: hypothetical protein R3B06_08520 [Kofleriaceae bacterium]
MRPRVLAAWVAAVALWVVAPARAQPGPDAGVPGAAVDGGVAGGAVDGGVDQDAGPPRIIIDGPTLLGMAKPQVSASASPTELRLGEKLTLFVEVVFDANVTVAVPAGLDLAPAFDELKRSTVDEQRTDGTRKRTYQIQLQVWELGDLRLPPIQVTYSVGGDSSWVVTNEVPLRVVGSIDAIDAPDALLGATPPVPVKRRDWRWVIVAGAAGAVLVGALAWWLVRRRRRRVVVLVKRATPTGDPGLAPGATEPGAAPEPTGRVEAVAPPPPRRVVVPPAVRQRLGGAAQRALAALDALEARGTLATDHVAGYREMVAITRTFFLEQFALPSRHRTSRELIEALRGTGLVAAARDDAAAWFAAADLVKFAAAPDGDGGVGALGRARALIVHAASGGGEVVA